MTVMTDMPLAPTPGWLHNRTFDRWFIFGITAIAIVSGCIVLIEPRLFLPILFLDLWLLGYQHVISTYTRICFDRKSFQEHKFLVVWLPIICLACVVLLAKGFGVWILTTIYLYWQWFHYTRQSWGVSQAYRRKEASLIHENEFFSKAAFYSIPVAGILYRMHQSPDMFLGTEVWTPDIPFWPVAVAGAISVALVGAWGVSRIRAFFRGELPVAHTAYLMSHFAIFLIGYILIEDITAGWLVINIWHNAQYVMFVWVFNNKRFSNKTNDENTFIARLSQSSNWKKYFLLCLTLSSVVYLTLSVSEPILAVIGLAPMIIIYQTINFHHYIVDSVIWKSKKKPANAAA